MTEERNIGSWLEAHPPDGKALVFEDGRDWTYGQLNDWALRIAAMLSRTHGVGRGDRVAFLGLNDPSMVALLFACARLGAILVPINWRLAPVEVAFIVEDCGPKVLFGTGDFAETARRCNCPVERSELLETAADRASDAEETGRISDPLLIIYTSGTTGRPKGAVLSQRAVSVNARSGVDVHLMTADDDVLVVLPLFHVGGLNITLTPALYKGATVHLHSRFDPDRTLAAIETIRPKVIVLVPATMQALMRTPDWAEADISALRMLTTGSMIVPPALIEAYEARGVPVVQLYGSTETCPIAVYTRPGEGRSNPRSTGRAGCCTEMRVVDADGGPVPVGTDGEIEVKGDHVMEGYWRRADETAEAFRDGWYRTGDIGALDEMGNLYFKERSKRMIISGGENIYPAEIERVLAAMPGIAECAVCGVPDDRWGEVPAAAILVEEGACAPTDDDLQATLSENLARFKHPRLIRVVDAMPRNVLGKVVHDELRAMLLGE